MRNALARALFELAKEDNRIVVVVADISPAGAMEDFRKAFPTRFINVGVAEASMIGLAAGLAMRGFKPFCYSIASFSLFRCYEFIRCDLAYQNLPVTVVGMGAGLSYSTLGGTHQAIEDVAVAMACPNLTVLVPCDPRDVTAMTRWCAGRDSGGPVYMRIGKAGEPDLGGDRSLPWVSGLPRWLRRIPERVVDTLVLSYGPIAAEALKVADHLVADMAVVGQLTGWEDDNFHTVIDSYDRVIVIEEASGAPLAHQITLGHQWGLQVSSFALPRDFPHAHGTREELLAVAGLTAEKIISKL